MQKLIVEKGSCNACGMCTVDCDLLQEDGSGIVDVIAPGIVPDHALEKVKNIVSLCPANALCLMEERVDQKKRLAELKEKMKEPLEWEIPSKWDYNFSLDDKNDFDDDENGDVSNSSINIIPFLTHVPPGSVLFAMKYTPRPMHWRSNSWCFISKEN